MRCVKGLQFLVVVAATGLLVSGCSMTFDPTGTMSKPMRSGASKADREPLPPTRALPPPHIDDRRIAGNGYDRYNAVTVARGDTLYSISRSHGVTPDHLMRINNLSSAQLVPGQRIYIR